MFLSVIVDDLYVDWAMCRPGEAMSPLLIDANAVLALSITPQRLETVAGRDTHEFPISSSIKLSQLASSHLFNVDKSFDAEAGV